MARPTPENPEIVRRAERWPARTAIVAGGDRYTYASLLHASGELARRIPGDRVVFLLRPGVDYVAWQWAIWRAGAVAVPLSPSQAPAEWDYIVGDVKPSLVIGDDGTGTLAAIAERRAVQYVAWAAEPGTSHPAPRTPHSHAAPSTPHPALLLYTSGTTSRPKGVVLTHGNLEAQMAALVDAWRWRPDDRILHVLPLNHVHGIVNVLGCALWAGACCEFLSPFDAVRTWERLASGDISVFMAVPTIYVKLLSAFEGAGEATRDRWASGAGRLRLMVSGSAALPVSVLDRWRAVTGHVLLERYGMTEIGMALSNPLDGPRRPGLVGTPLPGVQVRLVDEEGRPVATGTAGEIEVRGPSVFREYWQRPDATREAFRDGWFRTGDVAIVEGGAYRILGRNSVDIIKSGGYKLSALEIEEVLREHPSIVEVAVVGVPDEEWGERVAAAIVTRGPGDVLTLDGLRAWASARLAKYKLPSRLVAVASLPRNAMGKVVKTEVKDMFVQ